MVSFLSLRSNGFLFRATFIYIGNHVLDSIRAGHKELYESSKISSSCIILFLDVPYNLLKDKIIHISIPIFFTLTCRLFEPCDP